MTNLQRITGKIFGETATATGDDPQIGQFGSALAGTYVGTTDITMIQSLPAWSNGFIDSVTPNEQFPPLPEMTGFGKVLSYQNAYLLQKGVAEWDSGTTYYTGDFVKGVGEGKLYVSKIDENINNALTDTSSWEEFSSGNTRNIGEVVVSSMPLTDSGLHLLDGALISGSGSYSAFVTYIAGLYNSGDYTDIFTTEAAWQSTVTAVGMCNLYVYDSVNNTVRLPKWGDRVVTKANVLNVASTVPVKGNGIALGLTNGTTSGALCDWATAGYMGVSSNQFGSAVGTARTNSTNSNKAFGVTTDASKSGMVANTGGNITLTQYTMKAYYYVVIATSTKTDIEVDIDEIATDLNGKADVDLTNLADTGKVAIAHNAMPSTTKSVVLTLGASGSSITAVADGYVRLSVAGVTILQLYAGTLCSMDHSSTATTLACSLPVKKGASITVYYTGTPSTVTFRFWYAIGSESEAS